jgi:hypothetical protein
LTSKLIVPFNSICRFKASKILHKIRRMWNARRMKFLLEVVKSRLIACYVGLFFFLFSFAFFSKSWIHQFMNWSVHEFTSCSVRGVMPSFLFLNHLSNVRKHVSRSENR